MGRQPKTDAGTTRSQTLSRGLRALEVLSEANRPLTIDEIAAALEVHRSIAYRIVRTLEDHRLAARDDAGRYRPGAGLAVLAHGVSRDLQSVALPELAAVANELEMTSFVVVHDHDECITLASVEPRRAAAATVAQHPGTRHPLRRGAPGIALLMLLGADHQDRAVAQRVNEAKSLGYATSHDEVIPGLSAVALPLPSRTSAAIAVVYVTTTKRESEIVQRLHSAASTIAAQTG